MGSSGLGRRVCSTSFRKARERDWNKALEGSPSPSPHRSVYLVATCLAFADRCLNPDASSRDRSLSNKTHLISRNLATMRLTTTFLSTLAFLALPQPSLSSPGDYSPAYKRCVSLCSSQSCGPSSPPLPFSLRLFGWSCADDCSYRCMHYINERALALPKAVPPEGKRFAGWWEEADWRQGWELEGVPPGRAVQYHGKWPFKRFFGVQEPLSMLFSIFNLVGYLVSWRPLLDSVPPGSPLRTPYLGAAVFGINAWIWSTVFHARDRPWTERMDYFSAGALTLWGFYVAFIRVFRLFPSPVPHPLSLPSRLRLARAVLVLVVIAFCAHVAYLLSDKRFDYRYNMVANVAVGLTSMSLWISWSLSHLLSSRRRGLTSRPTTPSERRPPHAFRPIFPLVWLLFAGSLELLDFPPLFNMSLDAHALWHLVTIPLARMWCVGVLAADARWETQRAEEYSKQRRM